MSFTSKHQQKLDNEVEDATEGWVSVDRLKHPACYRAWLEWRKRELKSFIEPRAFTVPTMMPPATAHVAEKYVQALRIIRRSNQWTEGISRLPDHPSPYYGG